MSDRTWAILGLAAALTGCAAAAGAPLQAAGSDPAVQRGAAFAERRCAGCHLVGLDDGPASFGPRFRDLGSRYDTLSLQTRFAEISQHGSGEMPPIQIERREADDLVAYLRTLRAGTPNP
ncbi:cytochrome c [Phenylobacterium sp.]|uniref:c-type cytochrome n=1 Tax=Phenylobacterium sp. TaxID=1871053 RepID=UPI00273550FB|nr:cytochrome c [Phenylobacterium sp.]MDP3852698.1 cytochrome c [Phenylobacterium sp.]